ncbi:MAG TPA: hypothetical protein VGM90_13995 [Kofleriaceae bacterium]
MSSRLLSIGVVLGVLLFCVPADADAHLRCQEDSCHGPLPVREVREGVLAKAEKDLELANSRRVVMALDNIFIFTDDALVDAQLDLVAAVAGLRTAQASVRSQNPAKTIRLAYEANPSDPKLQAIYAESLLRGLFRGSLDTRAARTQRASEALRLLSALEARAMLPDANAWAALACGEKRAGVTRAATAAQAHCQAIAANKAVCAWALK